MVKTFVHPYIPNSEQKVKTRMMQEIGIKTIDELYADVPEDLKLKRTLNLPSPLSEFEVERTVESLLNKNKTTYDMPTFLGAGCWPHYVPAAVTNMIERTEFLTSYTPYQPEISQGLLQLLFEYQSMICELTGMGVANSSLYDWASALGEAARMTQRLTGREEILTPEIIHPERLATLQSYVQPANMQIRSVGFDKITGQMDLEDLEEKISKKTANIYVENPSYLGFTETNVKEIGNIAHEHGALFVVGVDPISLGVLEAPGEYGADIVIGEGQPLGNPMNFGGPLLGIFACRGESVNIRQMPGRIVGMTTAQNEAQRAYCMVLQTREQHIRRHKATSNICSNETLCALSATVYLALLGSSGLRELGNTIIAKSHYAMKHLSEIDGVECPIFNSFHFKEFTVKFNQKAVIDVHRDLLRHNIIGGKNVSEEFPKLGEIALYCVTETHSKETIDRLIKSINRALEGP